MAMDISTKKLIFALPLSLCANGHIIHLNYMQRFLLLLLALSMSIAPFEASPAAPPRDSVMARCMRAKNNIDTLEALLSTYRAKHQQHAQAVVLATMGKAYNRKSDYVKAIGCYQQAVTILKPLAAKHENDTLILGDLIQAYTSLATNCRRIGAFSNASEHLFNALSLATNSPNSQSPEGLRQQSYIYNGLGNVYKYLDDGEQAEKYFRLSIALDQRLNNNLGLAMNNSTLGSVYEHRGMFDSAKVMYFRALKYDMMQNSPAGIGICYNRIGHLAYEQNNFDTAKHYYLLAHKLLTEAKDSWNLARSALSLGQIYVNIGEYDKALPYIRESERLIKGKSYGFKSELHYCLSKMYEKQGLYQKALQEHKISMEYTDSSARQRSDQDVAHNRLRFEQEQHEAEIQRADTIIYKQRNMLLVGLGLIVLLIALLVLTLRLFATQRKYNLMLKKSNDLKSKFFSIISHDLKNPVAAQKATIDILIQNLDTIKPDDLRHCLTEFQSSSASLLTLLLDMLEWSRVNTNQIQVSPCTLDLHATANEVIEVLQHTAQHKQISLNNNIPQATMALADHNITTTVIRNLLNNAIKFSHENSSIDIQTNTNGKQIRLTVQDHGVGMSDETLKTLFSPMHKSKRGTNGETGTGLGLTICQDMLALMHTQLTVESTLGQGSAFSFELPPLATNR